MGIGSVIAGAIAVLLVASAVALVVFRRRLVASSTASSGAVTPTGRRLTSDALRRLDTPEWRVVHELPDDVLGAVDHVLIGPIGVVAIVTRLSPLPQPAPAGGDPNDARGFAASAVARAGLDDALSTVGMRSDLLVDLHWGRNDLDAAFVEIGRDHLAVDGSRLGEWLDVPEPRLTQTLVDHAWSTITTAVGRPDPLGASSVKPDRTR